MKSGMLIFGDNEYQFSPINIHDATLFKTSLDKSPDSYPGNKKHDIRDIIDNIEHGDYKYGVKLYSDHPICGVIFHDFDDKTRSFLLSLHIWESSRFLLSYAFAGSFIYKQHGWDYYDFYTKNPSIVKYATSRWGGKVVGFEDGENIVRITKEDVNPGIVLDMEFDQ